MRTSRSPVDGAPGGRRAAPPVLRPSRPRRLAALVTLLFLALGVRAIVASARARPAATPRPVPFAAGPAVRALSHRQGAPTLVLLYVSDRCPWCRLELRRWAELLHGRQAARLVVVLSPDSDPGGAGLIPPGLRSTVLHDADGTLGRELDVQAVPLTAIVRDDSIRSLTVGLTSDAARSGLLRYLDPTPPPEPDDTP